MIMIAKLWITIMMIGRSRVPPGQCQAQAGPTVAMPVALDRFETSPSHLLPVRLGPGSAAVWQMSACRPMSFIIIMIAASCHGAVDHR